MIVCAETGHKFSSRFALPVAVGESFGPFPSRRIELKQGIVCLLLGIFVSLAVQGQTQWKTFSNINNSLSGWGSCTSCAGGENDAGAYWMAQFQSSPARDGSSAEFYVSATEPYSNVLFWNKLGPQDWATRTCSIRVELRGGISSSATGAYCPPDWVPAAGRGGAFFTYLSNQRSIS